MQMKLINYLFIIKLTACSPPLTKGNNNQLFVQAVQQNTKGYNNEFLLNNGLTLHEH